MSNVLVGIVNRVGCPSCTGGNPCGQWVLTHNGTSKLSLNACLYNEERIQLRTRNTVFIGTRVECEAEISRLNLQPL